MVDITNDEFWDAKYDNSFKGKMHKTNRINKIIIIGLTIFIIALTTNIILLYNFVKILSEI